jgi:hypothetical protein
MNALSPKYARWLWFSSWMHSITVLVAVSMHVYDLALLATIVLFTSLNYWKLPDYGWRRYADILCVQIGLWWSIIRTVDTSEPCRTISVVCSCTMCLMFVISVRLHTTNVAHSTVLHILVHFFGNMATIVSILGLLPDFQNASIVHFFLP